MLAVSLGLIVGLVLGLTGAGGSVLAVPLLMWGMGWTLPEAAPVALLAVCVSATVGTLGAWHQGIVRYRAASLMAGTGLLTAPLGLLAAHHLPLDLLNLLFAAILVIIAVRLLHQATTNPEETRIVRATVTGEAVDGRTLPCEVNKEGYLRWTRPCFTAISLSGAGTGFLSGLLGVGGGFVIVPALRTFTALPIHSAIATSLMAIALTSAGTATYAIASGRTLPWPIALPFVLGALGGMLGGRLLAPRIAGPRLQQGFAVVVILVSLILVVKVVI